MFVRRFRLLVLLAGLMLATVATACGTDDLGTGSGGGGSTDSTNPSGAPLVSLEDAREAVERFMEANNEANQALDTSKLVDVETGSAAALDEAYYRGQRNLLGEGAEGPTFTWDNVEVYVPRTLEYPLSFLATVEVLDKEADEPTTTIQIQVYEKPSKEAGWKLSQYVNVTEDTELSEVAVDDEGYLEELDDSGLVIKPEDLPNDLVELFEDPDADSAFESTDLIDDTRQVVIDRVVEDARDVLSHDITYDVPSSPSYRTYSFPLRGGGALVLGVTGVRETIEPKEGTIDVPAGLTDGLVPEGDDYTRLEMRSLISFMAEVPAEDDGGGVNMVGVYEGFTFARAETE